MSRPTFLSSITALAKQPKRRRGACRAMRAKKTTIAMLAREVHQSIIAVISIGAIVSNVAMETSAVSVASKAITDTLDMAAIVEAIAMPASAALLATKAQLEKRTKLCTLAHLAKSASVARRVELVQQPNLAMLPTRACGVALTLIARIWKSPGHDGTETKT